MIISNIEYGISLLPNNCMAYRDGYRYGAYKRNLQDKRDISIVNFFKTKEEIQSFVNNNTEFAKEGITK